MSLSDLATTEAVLKAMADEIAGRLKTVRAEMQASMDTADGIRQVAAKLPDGTLIAKVSLTDPTPAAIVTDPEAFLGWVRDHHPDPDAIVRRFVTEVRTSTQTALLADMTAAGVPQWCDPATGEIHAVPGVEVRPTRSRSHSVRFEKAGREKVAEAWRAGQLTAVVMPEITAGGAE